MSSVYLDKRNYGGGVEMSSFYDDMYFVHAIGLDGIEYYFGHKTKEEAFKAALTMKRNGCQILSIKLRCFTDITKEFEAL